MVERCQNCGNTVLDDHSVFCNRCGARLTADSPGKTEAEISSVRRTSLVPAAPSRWAERPAGMISGLRDRILPLLQTYFSFDTFFTKPYVPVIYLLGAFCITFVSLLALLGPLPNATSFVSWMFLLVAGNVAWRFLCEVALTLFRVHDALTPRDVTGLTEPAPSGFVPGMEAGPVAETAELVKCPHCSATVRSDELRQCGHCGITGCVRCIKPAGLLRKTLSCRECFENR